MVREVNNPSWFGKLFFDLRMKSTLSLFFVLFLSLGLLVTIQQLMTNQTQDVRQQAASNTSPQVVTENFAGGTYEFLIKNASVSLVSLDEHVIYNDINGKGEPLKQFTVNVTPGIHTVKILYINTPPPTSAVSWRKI